MSVPQTYEEYLAQLNQKLSWLEKLTDKLGGTDERLDHIAKILIELTNTNRLILAALTETTTPGGPSLNNPIEIASGVITCSSADTAYPLPSILVPYDKEIAIKALTTNTGTIRVGNTPSEATGSTVGFPLIRGEGVSYKIKNPNQLWIASTVTDDGIAWTVEK